MHYGHAWHQAVKSRQARTPSQLFSQIGASGFLLNVEAAHVGLDVSQLVMREVCTTTTTVHYSYQPF